MDTTTFDDRLFESRERLRIGLERLELKVLFKTEKDPFDTDAAEDDLRVALAASWDRRLSTALRAIEDTRLAKDTIPAILEILKNELSAKFAASVVPAFQQAIGFAFARGKDVTTQQFKKQTGKDPLAKVDATFGMLFGLTEDHALTSLVDQGILSAGGLWDEQLSDSLRDELATFFDTVGNDPMRGSMSRFDLVDKLKDLVNGKLDLLGEASLPRTYFEALSSHFIVRSRNIGSLYRAKALGATSYRLRNPNDKRTSDICAGLTKGQVFEFGAAEETVTSILTARNISDLKSKVPFLKPGDKAPAGPVPPLHWKCRTWQEWIFDEELDALFADERNEADARDAKRRARIEAERARKLS
jgi:hypothetical protein